MAQVTLHIAGRRYDVGVRDGQEARFERLASLVDEKARAVVAGMGGINETRQLLMTALLLADDVSDEPAPPAAADLAERLDALAARIETLADKLEKGAPNT